VLNLPVPILSDEQRKSRKVFLAGHIGGTLGIALGLSLGMLPLLFISGDHGAEKRAFDELDTNKDNLVDKDELQAALRKAGIEVTLSHEVSEKLIAKYASSGRSALDAAEFHRLSADVKAHGPMSLIAVKVVAES
jgi:hypothetical protein